MAQLELMVSPGGFRAPSGASLPLVHVRPTAVAALRWLLRGGRVALLTTRDVEGALHTQPIEICDREFDGTLWLAAEANATAVDDVLAGANVQVTYIDDADRCLVIDGIARVCEAPPTNRKGFRHAVNATATFILVDVMSADLWE